MFLLCFFSSSCVQNLNKLDMHMCVCRFENNLITSLLLRYLWVQIFATQVIKQHHHYHTYAWNRICKRCIRIKWKFQRSLTTKLCYVSKWVRRLTTPRNGGRTKRKHERETKPRLTVPKTCNPSSNNTKDFENLKEW